MFVWGGVGGGVGGGVDFVLFCLMLVDLLMV